MNEHQQEKLTKELLASFEQRFREEITKAKTICQTVRINPTIEEQKSKITGVVTLFCQRDTSTDPTVNRALYEYKLDRTSNRYVWYCTLDWHD